MLPLRNQINFRTCEKNTKRKKTAHFCRWYQVKNVKTLHLFTLFTALYGPILSQHTVQNLKGKNQQCNDGPEPVDQQKALYFLPR